MVDIEHKILNGANEHWEFFRNYNLEELSERVKYTRHICDIPYTMKQVSILVFDKRKLKNECVIAVICFSKNNSKNKWGMSYVSVDPIYKGKGIATDLIKRMFTYLKDNNIDNIRISYFEEEGIKANLPTKFYLFGKENMVDVTFSYSDQEIFENIKNRYK